MRHTPFYPAVSPQRRSLVVANSSFSNELSNIVFLYHFEYWSRSISSTWIALLEAHCRKTDTWCSLTSRTSTPQRKPNYAPSPYCWQARLCSNFVSFLCCFFLQKPKINPHVSTTHLRVRRRNDEVSITTNSHSHWPQLKRAAGGSNGEQQPTQQKISSSHRGKGISNGS